MGEDWEGISSSLEEIRRSLLAKNGCIVNMTADGKSLTNIEKSLEKFLDLLPESPSGGLVTWDGRLPLRNEAIVIPTQVQKKDYLYRNVFGLLSILFAGKLCWQSR